MGVELSNRCFRTPEPKDCSNSGSIIVLRDDDPRVQAGSNGSQYYQIRLSACVEGNVKIGDYRGPCCASSLFLLGPNLPYRWSESNLDAGEASGSGLCISFSVIWIQRMVQLLPELDALPALLQQARQGLQFSSQTLICAQPLLSALVATKGAERVVLFIQLLGCLADCDKAKPLTSATYGSLNQRKCQARIERVVGFISQNFDQDLTLTRVASLHGMSTSYLSRLFKQATGSGFCDFLTDLRISRACELLCCSDRPITEICFDIGFKNISNFNRRFVALKQATPTEYRRARLT